jgi:cardiolipin synthase A/B
MNPGAAGGHAARCRAGCAFQITQLVRYLCMTAIAVLATGCASLPAVQQLNHSLDAPVSPTVTNAHGTLSATRSDALLAARGRNPQIARANIASQAALEEAATGTALIVGNKLTVLYDGPQTMAAMITAIRTARHHINLETYIFDQDELGIKFAELLIERRHAGVQVNVIYDSVGTIGTPQAFFDKMRDAGIQLLAFNPVNPLKLIGPWTPNNRDHRKLLIVDGTIAFTGGVNISDTYATSSLFRKKPQRNVSVG